MPFDPVRGLTDPHDCCRGPAAAARSWSSRAVCPGRCCRWSAMRAADLRHRRADPAAARRPRRSRRSAPSSSASAASTSSTSSSPRPTGHAIADYDDEIDAWIARCARAPEIAARRHRHWSTRRATSAGSPIASCCCFAADALQTALAPASAGDGMRRGSGRDGASCWRCRRPRSPSWSGSDPLGPVRPAARRSSAARRRASTSASPRAATSRRDGTQPAGHRAAGAAAVRRRRSRARCSRARRASRDEAAAVGRADLRTTTPLPPLQVEFAGGHRIAVETEAVVKRESIVNTRRIAGADPAAAVRRLPQPWLVAVGPLPSALSLLVVLGALGFAGATLSAAATGVGRDAVRPRRRRRRPALRRASRSRSEQRRRRRAGVAQSGRTRRAACCSACGRRRRRSTG